MKIYINASDVAAAIGFNRWKSPEDLIQQIWEKQHLTSKELTGRDFILDTDSQSNIINKNGSTEDKEKLIHLRGDVNTRVTSEKLNIKNIKSELNLKLKVLGDTKKIIESSDSTEKEKELSNLYDIEEKIKKDASLSIEAIDKAIGDAQEGLVLDEAHLSKKIITELLEPAVSAKSSRESKQLEEKCLSLIKDSVGSNNINNIQEAAHMLVNTTRGILGEEGIINNLESEIGKKITKRNDHLYYLEVCISEEDSILIGGRIDGFSEELNSLVEVKRRRNRFLGFPKYEKVQCEVYMQMLSVTTCIHTEMFDGESKSREYMSDCNMWKEILNGLENFKKIYQTYNDSI